MANVASSAQAPSVGQGAERPLVSVIVLNYNGAKWIERCLESLRTQTIFSAIEVIVADNSSTDGSDRLAERMLAGWPNGSFIQNAANLGYCEGNNRPAKSARGKFLLFLNNDTWLEPDCLETLLHEVQRKGADAGTPLMLDYEDDSLQSAGGAGFDPFGLLSLGTDYAATHEVFVVGGCSCFIARELFEKLAGFDQQFYMYADEYDLSWRLWAAGSRAVLVPAARIHHRGAANVNPRGDAKVVEIRSTATKRFYSNRNCLLVLLKNCQHILLLMVPLQLALLAVEAFGVWLVVRRFSLVRTAYLAAVLDCWRLRTHILAERRRLRQLRRRGDWWMLRFLRWRLNRWDELRRVRRLGLPRIVSG